MTGFRSFFIAAVILSIVSIAYGASLKAYNPYGVKKHTTTVPPLTTTKPAEMIRQCTCSESEECIKKAWSNITTCQEQCKSKLAYFNKNTDASLKCIVNNQNDATLANNCFKLIPGFCAQTNSSQIEKPTYEMKPTNKTKVVEHEIIATFKAFHICAGQCMKDIILDCFEEKECGVKLDDSHNIGKIGEFCHTLKASVVASSAKALPCLMPAAKPRRKPYKKQ